MKRAHVDFETFSELPIKGPLSVGSYKYARHASTEALCLGWAIGDEEPSLWLPGEPQPERLARFVRDGGLVWAWNAEFEIPVWQYVMVDRLGWEPVPMDQWRCSQALALSFAFPAKLELAGPAIGAGELKDKRGTHLLNKLSKPRKPSKNDPRTRWTYEMATQDYDDLYDYCRQDVRTERAVYHALPASDFSPQELEIWRSTVEMNFRGWQVDLDSTRRTIEVMEKHKVTALRELRAVTGGAIQTPNQHAKIRAWLADRGLVLPNTQADTITAALLRDDLDRRVRRLLELRQVLGRAATNKYAAQERYADEAGVVRNLLQYHGATTGRDAGRGIQIQNYLRSAISNTDEGVEAAIRVLHLPDPIPAIEALYCPVPEFAALLTRSMLTSRPGEVMYAGDYSSIENRLSVWYAACEYGLDLFRQGFDEYKKFGEKYFGVDYDDVTKDQRDQSKTAVLSLVFGTGWRAFMAKRASQGSPCSEEVAKETVDVYRKELYPEVVSMWYELEKAAKAAVGNPGRIARVRRKYAEVRFQVRDNFLFMKLASGRELAYHRPRIDLREAPWGEMKPTILHYGLDKTGWHLQALIPGRIFENLVQATARDIMMAGARRTRAAGYVQVGRVHDEIISEREEGTGDLDEYLELLCPELDWLGGVPITSEGWIGHRYKKG